MNPNLPRCWVCKKEGNCSKGTMKLTRIDEVVSIYLCLEHYENKEEIIERYVQEDKVFWRTHKLRPLRKRKEF